jgi:hypothetical protein
VRHSKEAHFNLDQGAARKLTASQPWRRACLAYREMRQAGASDQEAHEAAVEALQVLRSNQV